MISKATLRYIRISPRKVRPVIALVKGKKAEDAISTLYSVKKKASSLLIDVIKSAISNARRVQGVDISSLYVSSLVANGGPQLKRFRAGSMGRASTIRKRTSHITVELDALAVKEPLHSGAHAAAEGGHAKNAKDSKKTNLKEVGAAESSRVKDQQRAKQARKGKA